MAKPQPTKDTSDPLYRNFMCENYEKEAYLRMNWNVRHGDLVKKAAKLTQEAHHYTPADIYKTRMIAGMTNTTRENISSTRNRRTKRVEDYLFIQDLSTQPGKPTMKPVEEKVKGLIKESRDEYLKVRNTKAPEDKYTCIETTNMRYGWELSKNALKVDKAAYGKTCPLTNMIKDQRSGPHRDPDHYKEPF